MEFILVTLNYSESNSVDMKIPAYMPVEEFIRIICKTYNISGTSLQAEPLGILLNNKQTFAEQQIEHGALLTLHS